MKFLSIFGTRPEAIKMAPVVKCLKEKFGENALTCVTAQHREMLDQVLSLFEIVPEYDLNLMKPNQSLTDLSARILTETSNIIAKVKPDWVLVHGDTSTTLFSSLAAFYNKVNIAHVEAGLRSFDKYAPWPEEANRVLTDGIADLMFAPTQTNVDTLLREGIKPEKIVLTGNTVIDALLEIIHKLEGDRELNQKIASQLPAFDDNKKLILITGHRRENFGDGFKNICEAIAKLAKRDDVELVYPVHLNPNVQEPVNQILSGLNNVHLIEPLDYLPFVYLMNRSYFILSDSGGIQEEAPALGKPVLVMRDKTERPEAIAAGTSKLVGSNTASIYDSCQLLLDQQDEYNKMSFAHNPYGDGKSAERIVDRLLEESKSGV